MTLTSGKRLFSMAMLGGALALALALLARPGLPPAQAGDACPHENAGPGEASLSQIEASIKCLINQERADHDRAPLVGKNKLNDPAQSHTNKMVKQDCLRHKCAGEPGVAARLFNSGYLKGARRYDFGENLGYEHTPRKMLDLWLTDAYSRRNILRSKFEDIGIGARVGAPVAGKPDSYFFTFTTDEGFVRK